MLSRMEREGFQECPHCGKRTPEENLRCIYCSEMLPVRSGLLGSFRFGPGRGILIFITLFLLAFFAYLYLRHLG